MKKLFLFVSAITLAVSLNSCSSDSDGGGSSMSMKIDGIKKTFKTEAARFGGTTTVYGYIGSADDPTEEVSFSLSSGTGSGNVTNFSYDKPSVSYAPVTNLTSDVTTNSASSAKGTFSGTLEPLAGGGANVVITEGTFNVKVIAAN